MRLKRPHVFKSGTFHTCDNSIQPDSYQYRNSTQKGPTYVKMNVTSSTHEPMTGRREESIRLNAAPAGATSHGQPGGPPTDHERSRRVAKHLWKHGTSSQKTHAAVSDPSAAPRTWLNRPHQLWPAPDTGRTTSEIATDSKNSLLPTMFLFSIIEQCCVHASWIEKQGNDN